MRKRSKELQARLEERAEELRVWAEASDHWQADGAPPVAFDVTEIE